MSSESVSAGVRIRQLRETKGLTQKELAEHAGVSVGFLSELEHGKRNPSGRVLLRIATALGTTTDFILRGGEPQPPPRRAPAPIPPELADAAVRRGLSYRATAALAESYRQIVAQRSGSPERPPTADEWLQIYDVLGRYIEE
jgi:transcriptional regulator with XRE-family HTH domain